jgi:hypothetical protein
VKCKAAGWKHVVGCVWKIPKIHGALTSLNI